MTRYFTHAIAFKDSTVFLESGPDGNYIVTPGERTQTHRDKLVTWQSFVTEGLWKEITHDEAQALLDTARQAQLKRTTSTDSRPAHALAQEQQ